MKNYLSKLSGDITGQRVMLCLFPFFTFFMLKLDSVSFSENHSQGQFYLNFIVFLFTLILWFFANKQLKKLIFTMIFLSYLGEIIFCKLLGWYTYRLGNIPFYVPFGHAIVFASGYILSELEILKKYDNQLKNIFIYTFFVVFILLFFLGSDLFSLISGILFMLLIRRKRWQTLYFYIAFCVIFIELVGTYYGAWKWKSVLYKNISTLNPPLGAVFFYAGGDVLLVKIVQIYDRFILNKSFKKQT
jgi:hypothetical protein